MSTKLLGKVVWFGAKWYLRRRLAAGRSPRRSLALGAAAVGAGLVAMAVARRQAA